VIEISIIVQVREVAGDKKGRIAVGFSKILTETLVPQKSWTKNFLAAVDRAAAQRRRSIAEIQRIATEELPLFREPF
jgi:hypothetical protein